MTHNNTPETGHDSAGEGGARPPKGSLREALAAAAAPPPAPTAAEAARSARGGNDALTERVGVRASIEPPPADVKQQASPSEPAPDVVRTQLIRGRASVQRGEFHQDPVVGWLVVIGGPGLGAFRPIFEGNNTIGRSPAQRIPLDFGDETISSEEQAYLRYDSVDRSFLLVPNLAKTNVVAVNDKKPTNAVGLVAMDLITIGRTQLAFVPFCGREFDWAELAEVKG